MTKSKWDRRKFWVHVNTLITLLNQELILDTLHFCMFEETQSALDSDAMEVFTELLSHQSSSIRAKAARDIMDLRYIWPLFSKVLL